MSISAPRKSWAAHGASLVLWISRARSCTWRGRQLVFRGMAPGALWPGRHESGLVDFAPRASVLARAVTGLPRAGAGRAPGAWISLASMVVVFARSRIVRQDCLTMRVAT